MTTREVQIAGRVVPKATTVMLSYGGADPRGVALRLILEEWQARIPDYTFVDGQTPQIPWPTGTMGLQSGPLNIAPAGLASLFLAKALAVLDVPRESARQPNCGITSSATHCMWSR